MDPVTAITIAIAVIRGGIQIYQMIHDHPSTAPDVKVKVAAKIESDTLLVKQLEDARTEWEKRNDIQGA